MKVEKLTRVFEYNKKQLKDPASTMTPDQVKIFYTAQYPELRNAIIEHKRKGLKDTYTFKTQVGTKG